MIRKQLDKWQAALKTQDWRCTCFPNGWWKGCCRLHDWGCAHAKFYESEEIRTEVDIKLKICANNRAPKLKIGNLMFWGIRKFLETRKKLFGTPMY